LFEFTAARTVSLNAGAAEREILSVSARLVNTCEKYAPTTLHQYKIRRSVRSSQGSPSRAPFMTLSRIAAQSRLYGTIQSGSSLCIRLQPEHRRRRINNITLLPFGNITPREQCPRNVSGSPQIGQQAVSND